MHEHHQMQQRPHLRSLGTLPRQKVEDALFQGQHASLEHPSGQPTTR